MAPALGAKTKVESEMQQTLYTIVTAILVVIGTTLAGIALGWTWGHGWQAFAPATLWVLGAVLTYTALDLVSLLLKESEKLTPPTWVPLLYITLSAIWPLFMLVVIVGRGAKLARNWGAK